MNNSPKELSNKSRRDFLKAVAGAGTGFAFAGPLGAIATQANAKVATSGRIQVGNSDDITTSFDPLVATGALTLAANLHIFEGLVDLHPATRKAYLGLAAQEPVQTDPTTWRVTIRKGAKFHDGSPVTSEDVVFSFKRVLDPEKKSLFKQFISYIEDVKAVNSSTVEFKLSAPFALFKERLTIIKIVPKKVVEKLGEAKFGAEPIGSGPFKLITANKGDRVVFEAFKDYNGIYPAQYKDMIWFIMTDDATRVAAQESGRILAANTIPTLDIDRLKRRVNVEAVQSFGLIFLMFNCSKAPFDNPKVRQALHHGIDTNKIVDIAFSGNAEKASSYLQTTHSDYLKAGTQYPYDPKRAKKLLDEAGVKSLNVKLHSTDHAFVKDVAPLILESWNKIPGLKFSLEYSQSGALYGQIIPSNDFSIVLAPGDPSVFGNDLDLLLSWWYRGDGWAKNRFRWSESPEYVRIQKLLDDAIAASNPAESKRIWQEVINIIAEHVPLYPILHRKLITSWNSKKLVDFQPLPTTGLSFLGVGLKS